MRKEVRLVLVCNQAWTIYQSRKELLSRFIKDEYNIMVISDDVYDQESHISLIKKSYKYGVISGIVAIYTFLQFIKSTYDRRTIYILYSTKANILYGSLLSILGCNYICVVAGLGKLYGLNRLSRKLLMKAYSFVSNNALGVQVLNTHDYTEFSKFMNEEKLYQLKCEGFSIKRPTYTQVKLYKNIIMVSRLIPSKGVFHFLNSVKKLRSLGISKDYRFYLIGKFDETHLIDKNKIQETAFEAEVQLIIGAKDIKYYFESADCFVFPSQYNEGMPRVLFEAAEHGAFIITSDVPGCKDFIDYGFKGKKVKSDDDTFEERLAFEIYTYINSNDTEKIACKEHNIHLTPQIGNLDQIIDVYEEIFERCT